MEAGEAESERKATVEEILLIDELLGGIRASHVDAMDAFLDSTQEGRPMGQDMYVDAPQGDEPVQDDALPFEIRPVEGNREKVRTVHLAADAEDEDPLKEVDFGPDPYVQDGGAAMDAEQARTAVEGRPYEYEVRQRRVGHTPSYTGEDVRLYPMMVRDEPVPNADMIRANAIRNLSDGFVVSIRMYAEETGRTPEFSWLASVLESAVRLVEAEDVYLHHAKDHA